jgi:nucleolar complex protein 2
MRPFKTNYSFHEFIVVFWIFVFCISMYTVLQQENIQAVYSWQFMQSLHLWTEVLGATANRPHLQPLLYPLVQVTSVINL